jgi:hypothetical protein
VRSRLFAAVILACGGTSAFAGPVVFNFNTLGVSGGDNSAAVSAYMTAIIQAQTGCGSCSITISTVATDQMYNGEGHVVGPSFNGNRTSLTLGNSDGVTNNNGAYNHTLNTLNYDTFLANTTDGSSKLTDHISLTFSGFTISAAAFDFEIFPDQNGANDFELSTGVFGSDTLVSGFGTSGVVNGVAPGGGNGTSLQSPLSTAETSPQYISTWSGSVGSNVKNLNFIDWPDTIGVDNLSLTFTPNTNTPSSVPEPGSVVLLATVAAGFFVMKRKMRKA